MLQRYIQKCKWELMIPSCPWWNHLLRLWETTHWSSSTWCFHWAHNPETLPCLDPDSALPPTINICRTVFVNHPQINSEVHEIVITPKSICSLECIPPVQNVYPLSPDHVCWHDTKWSVCCCLTDDFKFPVSPAHAKFSGFQWISTRFVI